MWPYWKDGKGEDDEAFSLCPWGGGIGASSQPSPCPIIIFQDKADSTEGFHSPQCSDRDIAQLLILPSDSILAPSLPCS